MDVYNELDEGAEGGRFQYNQRHGRPLITPEVSQSRSSKETLGGGTYERGPKRLPKSKRKYDRQVLSGVRAASDQEKQRARTRMGIKEDIYNIILSHLLDEGYAETPEAAEVIMVNMSEGWRESIVEEVLDEAEGSYGQTPKAAAAYTALAFGKGKSSKTKSLALKHLIRSAADRYKSDKPYSHRSKMTQSDRDYHRGQSENSGEDREGIDFDEFDTGASGPGGKPKGKKLERQRKTGVSAD
jgi:hypothetical protein